MKNTTIATLLNIIPGLGYIYVGGTRKVFGIVLLIGVIASFMASFDPLLNSEEYMNAGFRAWDILSAVSLLSIIGAFMYDAYKYAGECNDTSSSK